MRWLCAAALTLALLPAAPASAATFSPTTTADANNGTCTPALCTLRDAVGIAQATPGNVVTIPPGRYLLSLGEFSVGNTITIDGDSPRNTIVDAQGTSRVFNFEESTAETTVTDLTVTGGFAPPGSPTPAGDGGGINNVSNLTLRRVAVVGNTASFTGGGINSEFETAPSGPTTTIEDSLIANNSISGGLGNGLGGGAALFGNSTITNTTISGNRVSVPGTNEGGGLASAKDLTATTPASLTLVNVTIANNVVAGLPPAGLTPDLGGGLAGATLGGIPVLTELTARNTLIANNTVDGATQDCGLIAANSTSFNLSSDGTCGFGDAGSKQNANPRLGPLANNGGLTDSLAIADGSPAMNAGTNTGCPGADQRAVTRPQALICDIGAVELKGPDMTVTQTASKKKAGKGAVVAAARGAKKLRFVITVSNKGEQTAPGATLTISLKGKSRKVTLSDGCTRMTKKGKKGKGKAKKRKRRTKVIGCSLGNLAPGTRTIELRLRSKRGRKLVSTATVSSGLPDSASGNETVVTRVKGKRKKR